jgi:sterol desaturase/sphingolipid hydroxylase (fatty acid hydroxylase superfamily)
MTVSSTAVFAIVVAAAFAAMLLFEHLRPLRREREPKLRRVARNAATGAIALVVAFPLQLALLLPVSQWMMQHQIGLLHAIRLPSAARTALALILLDYTLWIWHWANHRVPLLWRFHLVHHVDRDLDASTALRFHFGEQAMSVGYRAAQIVAIGAEPAAVWIWQIVLFVCIFFHHSNLRLPARAERVLVRLIVTPRMHGIHHAQREAWTNSNWSSILTVWDVLHRTLRLNVPDAEIVIGVPAYDDAREVTVGRIQMLPFRRMRDDWRAQVVHEA